MRKPGTCMAAVFVMWGVMPVPHAAGVTPTGDELADAQAWAAARFKGEQRDRPRTSNIIVLANHGPVEADHRGGEPLQIGTESFSRGLYCHANSKLLVHLMQPAKVFTAKVGIDSRAGGGSVVFSVRVRGEEKFHSEVLRCGQKAVPVNVELAGVKEFNLEIGDAGDGISCDQSNWADAKLQLADGSEVWLSDLPLVDEPIPACSTGPLFSFTYAGKPSAEFLTQWQTQRSSIQLDGTRRQHVIRYFDPQTSLAVRCVAVEYIDCPAIEWTLYFKNEGTVDTPLIESIQAIDVDISRPGQGDPVLHFSTGDLCTADSYAPHAEPIPPTTSRRFVNTGGRPTQSAFPYFNLAWPHEGVIAVLSWAGQWSAEFARDARVAGGLSASAPAAGGHAGLRMRGGQELTHFRLHPGEEVRSPMVVLLTYRGDWLRGQNLWRGWMVAHNLPRPGGELVKPMASLCTGNFYPGLMSNARQELDFLGRHFDEGIRIDAWWQDAGWYPCDEVTWPKTGTWQVDPRRFPKGLRQVSDFVHEHGAKSIVWFEPERVHPGTWLAQQHPEWIHGGAKGGLFKLSDPAARGWLIDHIDRLLTDQATDVYRQDFNIDPLPFWRAADAEDRQGITEIRHVEGYYIYWDELLKRHPGLLIDSCASGGRRNDLETLRRAVPLLRSDWYNSPEGQQCQTYGLSLWFPYQGTGFMYGRDRYWIRSSMVAEFTFGPAAAGLAPLDWSVLRSAVDEFHQVSECFFGDFYPLTPYTLADDVWMAWQYDRPDLGRGAVQVFRRPTSIYEAARLPLQGLQPDAEYQVLDLDNSQPIRIMGRELQERGLLVTVPARPAAKTVTYSKIRRK